MTTPVSLQKCLESVLDRTQAKRYVRNAASGAMPARYYYNNALRDLNSKDSEGAIHHLIMALTGDPSFEPALHLVKTMLFGLSKKYNEAGGQTYKQKYLSLSNWVQMIEKDIKEVDKEIAALKNDALKDKDKGLWRVIQLIFFKSSVKDHNALIKKANKKKDDFRNLLVFAAKLSQIEEYAKVLSLIVEICMYPARYAWVIT